MAGNRCRGGSFTQIRYARSTDGGVSFSAEEIVVDEPGTSIASPTGLVHDQAGRLHMTYFSDTADPGMDLQVYYLLAE